MNLQLQDYWLPRPPFKLDDDLRQSFDELLRSAVQTGSQEFIEYHLDAPKWQFLCYAVEQAGFALHGSLNRDITLFEPRQPKDLREFGAQLAIYAAADGIWPMYFAILDRKRYPTTLVNACVQVENPDGSRSPRLYFFSVGKHVIHQHPWTEGAVYLLPRDTFLDEPPVPFGEARVYTFQLASPVPVEPVAKLLVSPQDFPFLSQMHSHDDSRLEVYAEALNNGLPWPE